MHGQRREVTAGDFAHPTGDRYPSFGSSTVDHSAWSSQSFSVTVITCVAPSIATWPKNCSPSLGGRFASLGAFTYFSCGPNVLSSVFCGKLPAWIGPDTNSQNGSKSWNTALLGS